MPKFKVTVIRTDEYEIEVDENIWNKEALQNWSSVFSDVDDIQDLVKDYAISYMKNEGDFMEGFGYPKVLNSDGSVKNLYKNVPEEKHANGLSIMIIDEEEYEVELKKV